MATLNVRVNIGTTVLPNTLANRRRMFVYAGNSVANTGFGNINRHASHGQHVYDLNNPAVPGSISVTSFSRVHFSSEDLTGQAALVGNLADHIEATYIIVEDDAAPGVPLTRANLEAFI
jgi:hypothetical protein